MEMWVAALKWAMDFDSIVSRHYAAVAAEAELSNLKAQIPDIPLVLRSPAIASPSTPRQFSLGRDSLAIPLDDDVKLLIPDFLRRLLHHSIDRFSDNYVMSAPACSFKSPLLNLQCAVFAFPVILLFSPFS